MENLNVIVTETPEVIKVTITDYQEIVSTFIKTQSGTDFITEAPIDGSTYGRKNKTWTNVDVVPQVNSDWDSTTGVSEILNKPNTITAQQSADITTNNAKVGITPTQASDIVANNSKVGITPTQSSDIVNNNAKVGITTTQASNIVTNNAKVGITPTQASDITTNNSKVSFPEAPNDNKQYARKDLGWEEVTASSGTVDGTGTTNYVAKWQDSDTIEDSVIYDNGTNVGIGTTTPTEKLHVEGNARVTGAYYDTSNSSGTTNQILSSTVTGTAWIDPSTITAEAATLVVIACKNTSGATITKGTPVYQTGTVGSTDVIEIAKADSSDEDKMSAIGLLQTDLNNNGFGNVVITGELLNITTSPIDGVTPTTGDTIYVKQGGGLTLTKPIGLNFIQNVGLVGKVSGGNSGSITVSSIMRSNDVPTPLYVDHDNQRLGIGTTSPQAKLEVGDGTADDVIRVLYSDGSYTDIHGYGLYMSRSNSYIRPVSNLAQTLYIGGNSHNWSNIIHKGNVQAFGNGTSEWLRITSTGNVGIGTTTPNTKLHVVGIAQINESGNSAFYGGNYVRLFNDQNFNIRNAGGSTVVNLSTSGNSYLN